MPQRESDSSRKCHHYSDTLLAQGLSPNAPKRVTYGAIESDVLATRSSIAKNPRLALRQGQGLLRYTKPLRDLSVASVTTEQVLGVLMGIWTTKPTVAKRVRVLIESTLDSGRVRGLREGENVARWKGHLSHVLPARPTLTRGHHRSMPYNDVPTFYHRLSEAPGLVNRALQFLILTGLRKNEVLGLLWSDLSENGSGPILTVPAERMKGAKEHRVPITSAMQSILDTQRKLGTSSDLIFANPAGAKMNATTLNDALLRMLVDASPHGFRSSLRDWIGNETDYPRDLAEMCLGHVVSGVEGAYRRSDMLERRRAIMQAWSNFILLSAY
jgi:integrase